MKLLVPLGLALLVIGCGGTTIDGGELEDEIREDTERQGLVIDDVECPSPEAEAGDTFECTVTVKGQETPLEITQRNDDGNVTYNLAGLVEGPAVNDIAADEASIRSVMEALDDDITALCDYTTKAYRAELTEGKSCAKTVLDEYPEPFPSDYEISVDGDTAAVADDRHTVTFERQKDGSWLITDVR